MGFVYGFLLLLSSIPAGHILRHLTKEELKQGKKYFLIVWILSIVGALVLLANPMINNNFRLSMIFTMLFIANVAYINWK